MVTVLVVDDTDSIRRGLALLLGHHGFKAVLAEDGLEALELIHGDRPDLILLDLSMPGMDGLTVLETLRDQVGCGTIPVFIYSAVTDETLRRRAHRLGAEFVQKGSVGWDELIGKIEARLTPRVPVPAGLNGPGHHVPVSRSAYTPN